MKTRTQLLLGLLGLSCLMTLPVLAEKKPNQQPLNGTPSSLEQDVPATPQPVVPETVQPNSSVETAPVSGNVVEKAASSQNFQTLAKAITAADLAETLAGKGPYTVFAPTDEAFAALPAGILEQLLKPENQELLVQLLKSHVVSGAVTSSQIQPGNVDTLAGTPVAIQRDKDGTVTINNAKVTQADISASNGVIHAIDKVILPQETVSQLETTPKPVSQN
ncbi:MAG TPA: fasciclin domain-containing protein [Stenomitos sp.]